MSGCYCHVGGGSALAGGLYSPPLTPLQGGEVLAAGRARGPSAARRCLPQGLERKSETVRVKGSLRRAAPALDPANLTRS